MQKAIMKISFLSIIFATCLICFISTEASAFPVTGLTFTDGLSGAYSWRFYAGASANEGGPAGEWQALADGSAVTGYFISPRAQNMVTGSYSGLSTELNTYRAAWLIDQFAVGLGRNWQPAGYSGYSMTDGRTALAFAIYEVCNSDTTDALNLSDGYFSIVAPYTAASDRAVLLGQAYLNALSAASLDLAYLENNYAVISADQTNPNWNGNAYAHFVVPTQSVNAVPEPATLLLFSIGGMATALFSRKK